MAIEKEMRFFFSGAEKLGLWRRLVGQFEYGKSFYEKTVMYDNPKPEFSFYSVGIDGRLRVRLSSEVGEDGMMKEGGERRCLVTWKRRIAEGREGSIRKEVEYEFRVDSDDAGNVVKVFEEVLRCPRVESYERIRHFFVGKGAVVTLDEFPFGLMLEFELKGSSEDGDLFAMVEEFGLDESKASKDSCDDMYGQLCRENGISPLPDIVFGDGTMPRI
jgi:adenylate cyclase class IV